MKHLIKLTVICCSLLYLKSSIAQTNQEYNPYESIGQEAEVLTLSKGKYIEFFDLDSIEIIGDAILNTNTMKVIGFVERDTSYSEATLEPEIVSRWLSPDPLAREFPYSSPYVSFENNPIFYTDPDGKKVKAVNINAQVGLGEAIFNVFNTGNETNNPSDFFTFDQFKNVELVNVRNNKGKFTKEFKAALKTIESEEVKALVVEFVEAVESETLNIIEVVTNEESEITGTTRRILNNDFNTSNQDELPKDGSSTFVEKTGKNATLTISATETITNPNRVPGQTKDPKEMTSTSIGDNKSESLEVIKAIVTGNKAKQPK